MRYKLIAIARSLGRYAVAAHSSPGAVAAAGGPIILDAPSYSAPLLGYPGRHALRMA